MSKVYLTQSEVCKELGVSRFKFVQYIRDDFGEPVKVGEREYYTHSHIFAYRAKIDAKVRHVIKTMEKVKRAGIRPLNPKQLAAFR